MKLFTGLVRWGGLAAMAVATTALAQKEQWVDYHINRDGRGYRYLTLATNPPPNVKLPKLNALTASYELKQTDSTTSLSGADAPGSDFAGRAWPG